MKIRITDPNGNCAELEALEGFRVMEIIRDWSSDSGIGIKAECGGACACATCHVHVDEAWFDQLPPMRDDEEDRLDDAFDVSDRSRLSCQLIMSDAFDGLSLTIAPDASIEVKVPKVA